MTDKLVEEMKNQALLDNKLDAIIKKRIIVDAANFEYCVKNNVINGFLLAGIRQSMREYAEIYHEAKMREEKAKKFYDKNTCVVCHQNYVDSANGFDTCDYCLNRI